MSKVRDFAEIISAGIAADDAGLGNVTNESKATMFTSPTFTGTPTGITAAHLEAGVLPSDVTGGSGLTALGTVASGTLEDAVTYRNIDQDLASTDSPTFNNLLVSQIEGNTHYRSNFASYFPYYGNYAINTSGAAWVDVVTIQGMWSDGRSWLHSGRMMAVPPAGFTETFYLHVAGGPGSSGYASCRIRMRDNGSTGYYVGETTVGTGWHWAGSQFCVSVAIVDIGSLNFRTALTSGSNNSAVVQFQNGGQAGGNVGISQVILEQRIMFA